jgi:hypothetical protein
MNVARIKDGTVVNIEVADAEWVAAHDGVDDYRFVEIPDGSSAHIGLGYDPVTGFAQYPSI